MDRSAIGRSNSRRGKSHERRVAHLLTDWSGTEFRRRRVEGRDSNVVMLEGVSDVVAVDATFKFSVEAKCGNGFSLDALMSSPERSLFASWWHQTCFDSILLSDASNLKIYPMLFFKPSKNHDWVAFATDAVSAISNEKIKFPHLRFDAYKWLPPIEYDVSHSKSNRKMVALQLEPMIICTWKNFAKHIESENAFYQRG